MASICSNDKKKLDRIDLHHSFKITNHNREPRCRKCHGCRSSIDRSDVLINKGNRGTLTGNQEL